MFLLTRAILAIPLVVAALVALLSPKGVAANVVPHQPRMLRLYSRQVPVPEACLNICEMLVNTLDVRNLTNSMPCTELLILIF